MTDRHPGLRKRMELEARRIFSQHRQLAELLRLVTDAACDGSTAEACEAFGRFCDALESHFEIEESTHFPAIHGMDPESDARLVSLLDEHVAFRAQLSELRALLEGGSTDGLEQRIAGLSAQLESHELAEERLFEKATGETAPPR